MNTKKLIFLSYVLITIVTISMKSMDHSAITIGKYTKEANGAFSFRALLYNGTLNNETKMFPNIENLEISLIIDQNNNCSIPNFSNNIAPIKLTENQVTSIKHTLVFNPIGGIGVVFHRGTFNQLFHVRNYQLSEHSAKSQLDKSSAKPQKNDGNFPLLTTQNIVIGSIFFVCCALLLKRLFY